jgi:hypothetical protein
MPAVLPSQQVELERIYTQTLVFDTFAFLSVFSVVAALAPALFSPHVKRSRTWFGLLVAWLLYSVTYLLLIGHRFSPPLGLCIFQATLVYTSIAV